MDYATKVREACAIYAACEARGMLDSSSIQRIDELSGFDVIDTRSGFVSVRRSPHSCAMSAAARFNAGRRDAPFRVFATGYYEHGKHSQATRKAREAMASFFARIEASNGPDASDACGSLAMYARSHPEAYAAELAARGLPYVSPGPGPGLPPGHPHA